MVNDIGVDIDSLLHFNDYVDRIVAFSRIFSRIFSRFVSRNLHVLRRHYITFIRLFNIDICSMHK